MTRVFGRVNFFYAPAPLILDKRGVIAKAGGERDFFQTAQLLNDGVVLQHPLRECQIRVMSSGAIWRDDRNKNDVLDFVGRHLTSAAVKIAATQQVCNFYEADEQAFRDMVLEMYRGIGWSRLNQPDLDDLLDVGLVLDVKIDGAPVMVTMGPMEQAQLIANSFGSIPKPDDFELPERVWFVGMQDKEPVNIGPGGYADVRTTIAQRLGRWDDFAARLLNRGVTV